jgi:hypothetical protein
LLLYDVLVATCQTYLKGPGASSHLGAAAAAAAATAWMLEGSAAPDSCEAGAAVAVRAGKRVGRAGILYGIDDGDGVVGLDATADLPSDIVIINLEDLVNLDALRAPAAAAAAQHVLQV